MFGLIQPCRHVLDEDSYQRWQAHLCGLCLTLGARDGQWTRVLTNTDAVALSVLVEAQQSGTAQRVTARPCPGRGMRSIPVVPPEALSARLGATTSLTLASAKVADGVAERRDGLSRAGRTSAVRDRISNRMAKALRLKASGDTEVNEALAVPELFSLLSRQTLVERAFRPGDDPRTVTAPAAEVTAEVFASAAVIAGRPENSDTLREMGRDFGTLAHLLDAVADQQDDRRAGSFNPVTVSGWSTGRVRAECEARAARLRTAAATLVLQDGRLATWLFTVAVTRAITHTFASVDPERSAEGAEGHGPEPAALERTDDEPKKSTNTKRTNSGGSDVCECCTCCACCDCGC